MSEVEKYQSKEEFLQSFKDLYLDNNLPVGYSEKNKARIVEETTPAKIKTSMFASIPMRCKAEKCSFADTCPLQQEGIAPKNFPCPYEMAMSVQFSADYMDQLEVEPNNMVEVSIIRNLVDVEIQYLRASKFLAKESFIQENVVGMDDSGDPILRKELHIAVQLQDVMLKRQKEAFKQILASRDAKAKAGMGTLDTAQTLANLMTDFRQLQSQAEKVHLRKLGFEDSYDAFIEETEVIDTTGDG